MIIFQLDIDKGNSEIDYQIQKEKTKKRLLKFIFILIIAFGISFFSSIGMAKFFGFFIFIFGIIYLGNIFNNNSKKDLNYPFIKFENNGLTIIERFHPWEELKNIKININTYCDFHDGSGSIDSGWEFNYIKFDFNGNPQEYNIYINDNIEFTLIKEILKETILPKLYKLKNIKRENLIIEKLDYSELQKFKQKNDINRLADDIHFNI